MGRERRTGRRERSSRDDSTDKFSDYTPKKKGRSGPSRGGFSRGGSRSGGAGRGGRNRRDRPEMHEVTCDQCNKQCKVPFLPSSDKPVYCSECFEEKGDSRGGSSRSGGSRNDFEMINKKLDKIMKALKI